MGAPQRDRGLWLCSNREKKEYGRPAGDHNRTPHTHARVSVHRTDQSTMAAVTMNMAAVKAPVAFGAKKSTFSGSRVSAVAPKTVAGGRASLQVRNDS